jgi:hypothetical protein
MATWLLLFWVAGSWCREVDIVRDYLQHGNWPPNFTSFISSNFCLDQGLCAVLKAELFEIATGHVSDLFVVSSASPSAASSITIDRIVFPNTTPKKADRSHMVKGISSSDPEEGHGNVNFSSCACIDNFSRLDRFTFEGVRSFLGGPVISRGFKRYLNEINPSGRVLVISREYYPKTTGHWSDLANIRSLNLGRSIAESRGAIGSDHKPLAVFDDNEAAGVRYADIRYKRNDPKYIRIEQLGETQSGVFYEGHKSALLLNSLDVDVSSDGHNWFHAFGPKCTRSLKNY